MKTDGFAACIELAREDCIGKLFKPDSANSEVSSSTKLAHYTLLFGRHTKPRRNLFDVLQYDDQSSIQTPNSHSFVNNISKETLKLKSEASSRRRNTLDANPSYFEVNDLVLLDDAPNKLLNLLGPFQVIKKLGSSGYEIKSIVADQKRTVSANALYPFSPNNLDENQRDLPLLTMTNILSIRSSFMILKTNDFC
ncbi:hypothetical protein P9112_013360 [Eukaryota sp. TZLM1-RC]